MANYKWKKTKHKGLEYRDHATRKHGVKKDKFYRYRIQIDGERIRESFGWLSEGWTMEKCLVEIARLKQNRITGEGPATLKEQREIAEQKKAEQKQAEILFSEVWDRYKAQAIADRGEKAIKNESGLYRNWIEPDLTNIPIKDVSPFHLEKIKAKMAKAGRAPRSIEYVLAIIRQVFNYAKRTDLFAGDNPVSKVKIPRTDNRRVRFLTHDEADTLLTSLMKKSKQVHDMALMSLHTGARAGEIFCLTWGCVDLEASTMLLKDTKNTMSRTAFMTAAVKDMLDGIKPDNAGRDDLVFPGVGGVKIEKMSKTFPRVAADLFNQGVDDPRQRVFFHTLRHTYASWLVMEGVDLYRVKELLGHKDLTMTQRYSHLAPDSLRGAVNILEAALKPKAEVIPIQQKA
ncbi:MAG: site-specific integrase [Desulfotignum sp.]|nr:site-specific integrase [Desulfotignum sp.]